jgi:hypothetical protein
MKDDPAMSTVSCVVPQPYHAFEYSGINSVHSTHTQASHEMDRRLSVRNKKTSVCQGRTVWLVTRIRINTRKHVHLFANPV